MHNTKTCTRCHQTKHMDAFGIINDKRCRLPRRNPMCKACNVEKAAAWNKANPERAAANQAKWRKDKREDYLRAAYAATSRYLAARAMQTPPWADLAKIADIYELAAALRAEGMDVAVDHIVPLQGKTASGLHTHHNLQIIERRDNARKNNRVPADPYAIPNALQVYAGAGLL